MGSYIKNNFSEKLMEEIKDELERIGFGSLEIYVQNNKVTQITVRNIKKTNVDISDQSVLKKNGDTSNYQNYDNKIKVLTIKKQ